MKTVMIVDDASFMRNMLRAILTKHRYNVIVEATNGLEAVQNYEIYKPDLVIMDITMPIMDGLEATEVILKKDSHAKIIVCSAIGHKNIIVQLIHAGAKDFIVKPFHEDQVLTAIRKQFQFNL